MSDYTTGDTSPPLTGIIGDYNRSVRQFVPTNATGATAEAHIKRPDKTVLTKSVTWTTPLSGEWSVTWAAGDLDQRGRHYVEIEVTFAGGAIQTFAEDGNGEPMFFNVRPEYA